MTNPLVLVVVVAIGGFASGCATSTYEKWGAQLQELPRRNGRVDDVSLLLGAPPMRCEPVKNPQPAIGVGFADPKSRVVGAVRPSSTANEAGIRPGDSIESVGGQLVNDGLQLAAALRANAREGSR